MIRFNEAIQQVWTCGSRLYLKCCDRIRISLIIHKNSLKGQLRILILQFSAKLKEKVIPSKLQV